MSNYDAWHVPDLPKLLFSLDTQCYLLIFTCFLCALYIPLTRYRKMDLMKFIQDYNKTSNDFAENKEKFKGIYQQKEIRIKALEAKIEMLEKDVENYDIKTEEYLKKIQKESSEKADALESLKKYEELMSKIITDNDTLTQEKKVMQEHLNNMEESFKELLAKFERAKEVIEGLAENEKNLQKQKEKYKHIIDVLEHKYLLDKSMKSTKKQEGAADRQKMAQNFMRVFHQ